MRLPKIGGSLLITIEVILLAFIIVVAALSHAGYSILSFSRGNDTVVSADTIQGAETADLQESDGSDENALDSGSENAIGDNSLSSEDEEAAAIVAELTTEQKVAQLFFTTPEQLTGYNTVTSAGSATKSAIESTPVGGLVFTRQNITDQDQITGMMEAAQGYYEDACGVPAFLAIAELGGRNDSPVATKLGFEIQEAPQTIGQSQLASTAAQASKAIGQYLTSAGFNMVLGPVCDLSDASASYGTDAENTAAMVSESVDGFHDGGVMTVAASFPSSGMDDVSSYQAAASADTEIMMLANIEVDGIDDGNVTFSSDAVDYIRETMNYDGIIMSGSLSDYWLMGEGDAGETAVKALQAGCDMIYLPGDFTMAYEAVLEAVNDGTISEDQLNESVRRIVKAKLSLLDTQ